MYYRVVILCDFFFSVIFNSKRVKLSKLFAKPIFITFIRNRDDENDQIFHTIDGEIIFW